MYSYLSKEAAAGADAPVREAVPDESEQDLAVPVK
jgi:hypothetical protein